MLPLPNRLYILYFFTNIYKILRLRRCQNNLTLHNVNTFLRVPAPNYQLILHFLKILLFTFMASTNKANNGKRKRPKIVKPHVLMRYLHGYRFGLFCDCSFIVNYDTIYCESYFILENMLFRQWVACHVDIF